MSEIDEDIREKAEQVAFDLPWVNVPNKDFDEGIRVIARALQDERDGGWQDIATADQCDDELFLVATRNGSVLSLPVAQFKDPLTQEEIRRLDCASYEINGKWPDAGYLPTHWMPLPRPPHSKDSEG